MTAFDDNILRPNMNSPDTSVTAQEGFSHMFKQMQYGTIGLEHVIKIDLLFYLIYLRAVIV